MIGVKSIAYIGAGIDVPKAVPLKIDIAVAHKGLGSFKSEVTA